ncbi:MAG: hypothetical protein ACRDQZ_01370 [Mycobacteriales bacterium]
MGLFSSHPAALQVTCEQTVTVRFALGAGPGGTATDTMSVAGIERKLELAIRRARAGEFDGSEFAGGELFLYAYGPDADELFAAMRPVLTLIPAHHGKALLRYGPDSDAGARETIFEL